MEQFSRLVGEIYDTVIDPGHWPSVLRLIAEHVGALYALLIVEDAVDPTRSRLYVSSENKRMNQRYTETYLLLHPMRLAMVGRVKVGDVILTTDFMSRRQYEKTRFFREFLVEEQIVDVAATVLEKTATTITVLSLLRGNAHGPADRAVRHHLELLGPHVRRAAQIGRVLERTKHEAAGLADTLDRLGGAVFLLDEAASILHANEAARLDLDRGDILRSVKGKLVPCRVAARPVLARCLAAATAGDIALEAEGSSVLLASDGERPTIGTLISLASGARRLAGGPYRAVAALFVRQVGFEPPMAAETLKDAYDLTSREVAVLISTVENGGPKETANVLGMAENTVKSHLKAIFRKTGAARQADLVKMIAGTATPFGPPAERKTSRGLLLKG